MKPRSSITLEQLRNPQQKKTETKMTERVFVHGQEVPELASTFFFPSGEKNLICYHDFLDDVVSRALDPIRDYVLQIDNIGSPNQKDSDMIRIISSLEYAARKRLCDFIEEVETHIGRVLIRRISYENEDITVKGSMPEKAVSVDLLNYEEVES